MTKEENNFLKLKAINVNEHVEKKKDLNYLSWAWAVDYLLQNDPLATWTYKYNSQGEPYIRIGEYAMVECTVTAFGKSMTAQLPVMDSNNKPLTFTPQERRSVDYKTGKEKIYYVQIDSFTVNTAMQRCLAKAIGLHGLGLYIYQGEDLPTDEGNDSQNEEKPLESSYKRKETHSINPQGSVNKHDSNNKVHETKSYNLKTDEKVSQNTSDCSLVCVHFGKNKGIALKDLPEKSLRWYMENWAVETQDKPNASEADKRLVNALEEYARQITTAEDKDDLPMEFEGQPDQPF